jgi:hypothetical protein
MSSSRHPPMLVCVLIALFLGQLAQAQTTSDTNATNSLQNSVPCFATAPNWAAETNPGQIREQMGLLPIPVPLPNSPTSPMIRLVDG